MKSYDMSLFGLTDSSCSGTGYQVPVFLQYWRDLSLYPFPDRNIGLLYWRKGKNFDDIDTPGFLL